MGVGAKLRRSDFGVALERRPPVQPPGNLGAASGTPMQRPVTLGDDRKQTDRPRDVGDYQEEAANPVGERVLRSNLPTAVRLNLSADRRAASS